MTGLRWATKKVARVGFALAGAGYVVLSRLSANGPKVRVLTYHRFGRCDRDPFTVDIAQFEQQMAWLAARKLAISLADLDAFLAGRKRLRNGSVLVTIDDGYEEVASAAMPILRRFGIPAVVFVSGTEVRDAALGQTPGSLGADRVSVEDLSEMLETSIEVGSHSWDHRSLGEMKAEAAQLQLARSKRHLESLLGRPIGAFAYPFGTWKDFNATTTRLLGETGYRFGFTSQHGAVTTGSNPHVLPRTKIEGGEPLWMFKLLVAGALDLWSVLDRVLWRLQQREVVAVDQAAAGSVEHA